MAKLIDQLLKYQGAVYFLAFTVLLAYPPISEWIHSRYGYYGQDNYIAFWLFAVTAGLTLLGFLHCRRNQNSSTSVIFGVVINGIYSAIAILLILVQAISY